MKNCPTGKRMYATPTLAEDVLIESWIRNDFPLGSGPVAVYECNECRQFHLTSSGIMNPRLSDLMQKGELRKLREARFWNDKLTKRR